MTDLETRLTDALREGAERAPHAVGLADGARRRSRSRRRTRAVVGGAVLTLAVAVPVSAVAALDSHGSRPGSAASSSQRPSAAKANKSAQSGKSGKSGVTLDSCAVVTADLVNRDFGSNLPAGTNEPFDGPVPTQFGDPASTDCWIDDGFGLNDVLVTATTRADADLPARITDPSEEPGAQPVPGADRGFAWLIAQPSSEDVDTVGAVIVVKGQIAISVNIGLTTSFTIDDLQRFAQDVLAAIEARS